MEKYNIYQQIADRTQGDIYIGVVGPVRTGKSTFIKRFMDLLVLPNIENSYQRERAKDELPQSAAGRTIMTTEPKFVPNEAVRIVLDDAVTLKVRLVDCVGYLVRGALGYYENNAPRMVTTPWFEKPIPFNEAAEIGTRKVINDHSTIGFVVTTDGSITDLGRDEYIEAEERVVGELKKIDKPFVILLNSTRPYENDTQRLGEELEQKYRVPVISVNCAQMRIDDIHNIMERILYEFPIREIGVNIPGWMEALDDDHWLREDVLKSLREVFKNVHKVSDMRDCVEQFGSYDFLKSGIIERIDLSTGAVVLNLEAADGLFYRILSETTGMEIDGDRQLISLMKDFSRIRKEYEKVEYALHEVRVKGYGMVSPLMEEITLEEPEIIKQGGRFGVRLRASAPSIHMIRADIETEIAPLVGTEKQSEELVSYLLKEFEDEPGKIWKSNIFGKSVHELISEGLHNKLFRMPEDAQLKLQETLQRIINEGSGGLICIIL